MLKRITLNLIALATVLLLCSSGRAFDSQRDLSLYPLAARASILRGLADGSVHFEPSESGGEYISEKHATR